MGNENGAFEIFFFLDRDAFEFWSQSKNFRKYFYNVQIRNQRLDFFFCPFMPTHKLNFTQKKKKEKTWGHFTWPVLQFCCALLMFSTDIRTPAPAKVEAILYPLSLFQYISLAWLKNSTSIIHKQKQKG